MYTDITSREIAANAQRTTHAQTDGRTGRPEYTMILSACCWRWSHDKRKQQSHALYAVSWAYINRL